MKLILDQNLSRRLKTTLADIFDEVRHVSGIGLDEADDIDIWRFAREREWTIMSKDGDFADMALLYGAPPKVIPLRIGNGPWHAASDIVSEHVDSIRSFLADPESSLLVLSRKELM